jgi:hypothetical protein
LPLPQSISPNPLDLKSKTPWPRSLFEDLYKDGDKTKPLYAIARFNDEKGVAHDGDETDVTIGKVTEVDARDEV